MEIGDRRFKDAGADATENVPPRPDSWNFLMRDSHAPIASKMNLQSFLCETLNAQSGLQVRRLGEDTLARTSSSADRRWRRTSSPRHDDAILARLMQRIAQAKLCGTICILDRVLKSRSLWGDRAPAMTSHLVHVCGHSSINALRASHHYAAVMNYAVVMKKRCFA